MNALEAQRLQQERDAMREPPRDRRDAQDRRDVTRDQPDRRLLDRIRELDPTLLECGPECYHP